MIPKAMTYEGKREAAGARRYRTSIQPQTGAGTVSAPYAAGQTIVVNIATGSNQMLIATESTLSFKLAVTGSAAATLALDSCGAHGIIQRLRLYHGSNLLQDIDNYQILSKLFHDWQAPNDSVAGRLSITAGTNSIFAGADSDSVRAVNRGLAVGLAGAGDAFFPPNLNATASTGMSIVLNSLVGGLATKYLPVYKMGSSPLRLELVLSSAASNFCYASAGNLTGFKVYEVNFNAEYLQLSDAAIASVERNSASPLQLVFPDWRNYQFSQTLTAGIPNTVSVPVPAKFSSLRGMVATVRDASAGIAQFPSIPLVKAGLQQYQWRIGGTVVPTNPVNQDGDFFNETAKVFGSLADMNYQPSIDLSSFVQNASVTTTSAALISRTDSGSFATGIDISPYMAVDTERIYSGVDTTTDDIFYNPILNPPTTGLYTFSVFACYDCVLVCESGSAYVKI
jgi:hypothetical protein